MDGNGSMDSKTARFGRLVLTVKNSQDGRGKLRRQRRDGRSSWAYMVYFHGTYYNKSWTRSATYQKKKFIVNGSEKWKQCYFTPVPDSRRSDVLEG